jgi:site-specific DNA-cytosine methylase
MVIHDCRPLLGLLGIVIASIPKVKLTEGSLFAGIMGFGKGFRQAGFRNVWAVEKNRFCRAVIKTHFPPHSAFGRREVLWGEQP